MTNTSTTTIKPPKRSPEERRKRAERERTERANDRQQPSHMFHDVGPAIAEADCRPRIYGNPEETLEAALTLMKRDYGGPLPAAGC